MITLITGTPGAGKTLYTVAEELPKFKDRPLFVHGIPDLLIDHELPAGEVDDWKSWLPKGAVLVVDECQHVWRVRGAASKVPPGVAAMETHRHTGNDIVLITQHPNLLDPNVRRLVGRHLHVRRMFGWKRAIVYEWDAATDPARVSNAIKRSWAYPKKAFSLYKSSEQHNKRGQRIPLVLIVAVLAGLGLPAAAYYAYSRTQSHIVSASTPGAATELATARAGGGAPAPLNQVPESIIEATTPKDPHNYLSAPLYAAVVPSVHPPEVSGCIASKRACSCYSQQSTPVWMPDEQCRQRAAGLYYDPYRQPPPASQTQPLQTSTQSLPGGLARGFDDGTKPDVPRSPVGVSPPSGERVSGAAPV